MKKQRRKENEFSLSLLLTHLAIYKIERGWISDEEAYSIDSLHNQEREREKENKTNRCVKSKNCSDTNLYN